MVIAARPISLEEALRTLGHELEWRGVSHLVLAVDEADVTLQTTPDGGPCHYLWQDLLRHSRAQRQARRPGSQRPPWSDAQTFTTWPVVLRGVGRLLDTSSVPRCRVTATIGSTSPPRACELQVWFDGQPLFQFDDVRRELLELRSQQGEAREQSPPAPRAWWAFGRRR